jgi:hypothetical protein
MPEVVSGGIVEVVSGGIPEVVGGGILEVVSDGVTGFCREFTCAVSKES